MSSISSDFINTTDRRCKILKRNVCRRDSNLRPSTPSPPYCRFKAHPDLTIAAALHIQSYSLFYCLLTLSRNLAHRNRTYLLYGYTRYLWMGTPGLSDWQRCKNLANFKQIHPYPPCQSSIRHYVTNYHRSLVISYLDNQGNTAIYWEIFLVVNKVDSNWT